MGNSKLSDQHIFHLVESYASDIKTAQILEINACKSANYTIIAQQVDIYDADADEVIFLSDGVCVNEQKTKRDKIAKVGKERTITDIMMLQTSLKDRNTFKTIIAAEGVNPIDLVQSEVFKAYGKDARILPIVSISDGALSIKKQNKSMFGQQVTPILD